MVRIHENTVIAIMLAVAVLATLAGIQYVKLANEYAMLKDRYTDLQTSYDNTERFANGCIAAGYNPAEGK